MDTLATEIRAARGGRSIEEFAAALGCSANSVRRWEEGSRPRSRAHIRLLEIEGVNVNAYKEAPASKSPEVAA